MTDPAPTSSASRLQTAFLNAAIMVVSIVVMLFIVEFGLGFTDIGVKRSGEWSPQQAGQRDSSGVRRLVSNYDGRVVSKDFSFAVRANSVGLREEELPSAPDSVRDLIFLGDSYFFGHGVERNERFSEVLDTIGPELGMEPFQSWNISLPGGNPLQELATLKAVSDHFPNGQVVLGIFVGNDFMSPSAFRKDARPESAEGRTLRNKLKNSRLFNVAYTGLWSIGPFRAMFNSMDVQNDRVTIYQPAGGERQERIFEATADAIQQIIDYCRQQNMDLSVVLIPDHLQVLYPETYADLDLTKPQRFLRSLFEAENVPLLDLYPAFIETAHPDSLMFIWDKHWNVKGHQFVAGEVARFLLDQSPN